MASLNDRQRETVNALSDTTVKSGVGVVVQTSPLRVKIGDVTFGAVNAANYSFSVNDRVNLLFTGLSKPLAFRS